MMTQKRKYASSVRVATIVLASVLLQPLANAQAPTKSGEDSTHGSTAAASSMSAGSVDMKAMMIDMNQKMSSMPMTGNPDLDFAMMMRIHHQTAIDMAEAELRDGKDRQMRKMAKDIISAQQKEIEQLDKFLAKHGHAADKMTK